MARKPRIEFEGAFYHVITRGNQRQKTFKDQADYQKYLQFLTICKNRYHFFLYAFVLMPNHVHLLVEAGKTPLSKIMQGLNQRYTLYFNRKYRTVGHLFQGRYRAIVCDKENYLLALIKYIHHNPLRARLVDRLDRYSWSSHPAYLGKSNPLNLVDTDHVLRLFSESRGRARGHYRAFMQEAEELSHESVYTLKEQRVQGDDAFVERVLDRCQGEENCPKKLYSLNAVAHAVERAVDISKEELQSGTRARPVAQARKLFSFVARGLGYSVKEIAAYIAVDAAAVSGYERERAELTEMAKKISALVAET